MVRVLRRFVLSLALSLSAAFAQNPATSGQAPLAEVSPPVVPGADNRRIRLDVQVADKSGVPIRGLQKQDFSLLDGKQPLGIRSFQTVDRATSADDNPVVEIVLVVDAINASTDVVNYERKELKRFLLENDGKLAQPVELIFFSGAGKLVNSDFSGDGNALFAKYKDYEPGPASSNLEGTLFSSLAERFDLSVRTLSTLAVNLGKEAGQKTHGVDQPRMADALGKPRTFPEDLSGPVRVHR